MAITVTGLEITDLILYTLFRLFYIYFFAISNSLNFRNIRF